MMNINEVQKRIKQRPPFQMIEKIVEIRDGEYAKGIKNVSINEPYFMGHFPDTPIMPGVLHVEAIAQACGLMCLSATTEDATGGATSYDTILTGIEHGEVRGLVGFFSLCHSVVGEFFSGFVI